MPPSIDQIIDRLDSYPPGTTFNVKEIATILELPNDTVAARLNRDKETYKRYLSRKKAGVGSTYEYRLDREAIMNMVNDPRYRGSYRINNLKPKKQEPQYQDNFDKAMNMIRGWNSNEVSKELLERIPKMEYEVGTWYPMNLAPKDGTRIIVCSGDAEREVLIVEWKWSGYGKKSDKKWWDWCIIYGTNDEAGTEWTVPNPIKWMPCPLP